MGKFTGVEYKPSAEQPDQEYPFILTTGRMLYHYHTGSMTRKIKGLNEIAPNGFVEISIEDGKKLGIKDGEIVEVTSRRGKVKTKAQLTKKVPPGVVYMNFHFSEEGANMLTNTALDPVAKIPELKVCAVRIDKGSLS